MAYLSAAGCFSAFAALKHRTKSGKVVARQTWETPVALAVCLVAGVVFLTIGIWWTISPPT
jgi:hypothetical protein